jgi:SRSO17 transposase
VFPRVEPRRQARKYVTGLIADVPRKNCWALAEQAGDATPDKMQRLLERACWDAFAAMTAVRAFSVGRLGDPADAVLVIDESGQRTPGRRPRPGTGPRASGTMGGRGWPPRPPVTIC